MIDRFSLSHSHTDFIALVPPSVECNKVCIRDYTWTVFSSTIYRNFSARFLWFLNSCYGLRMTFTLSLGRFTPIECSAIGLLTLCLTETHTELRTQRVDLLENNIHYIQNSTSPISFKFRSQIKIPNLVPFVPVGV